MKSYTLRGGGKVHLCSSILFPCKRSRLQKDRRVTQSGMEVHKYLKSSTKPIYEHKLWHKQKAKKKRSNSLCNSSVFPRDVQQATKQSQKRDRWKNTERDPLWSSEWGEWKTLQTWVWKWQRTLLNTLQKSVNKSLGVKKIYKWQSYNCIWGVSTWKESEEDRCRKRDAALLNQG